MRLVSLLTLAFGQFLSCACFCAEGLPAVGAAPGAGAGSPTAVADGRPESGAGAVHTELATSKASRGRGQRHACAPV